MRRFQSQAKLLFASGRSASTRFRSLISRAILETPTSRPCPSRIGETTIDTSTVDPSLRSLIVSRFLTRSPRHSGAFSIANSSSRSVGIKRVTERPITSSAV